MFIILYIFLLLYIGNNDAIQPTYQPTGIDNQINALQIIYNDLGGLTWIYPSLNSTKWNFTCAYAIINPCNICTWSGLECITINGITSIKSIDLSNYNVSGKLPDVFNNFNQMNSLIFDNNPNIGGSISTSLYSLSNLSVLSFLNTTITGTIPTQLFLLPISQLRISYSYVHGVIPSEIGNLKATLTVVSMYSNSISGTIPTQLGYCTNLYYLNIRFNKYS